MADTRLSDTIVRALTLVSAHPAISHIGAPSFLDERGAVAVDVTFDVNLPQSWRRAGQSPSEVRLQEKVRLAFPSGFPLEAPEVSLRPDFNRNLPHMQPWLTDGRPVPCLYDGALAELLHHEGLAGILNQTAVWLEHAALGTLIDPKQGWEPVRRDSFADILLADAEGFRRLVDRKGGYRFFELDYLRMEANGSSVIHGHISGVSPKLNTGTVSRLFREMPTAANTLRRGRSLALVVWPGKLPSGKPIISDVYLPETVTTASDLKQRAELYGCARELEIALNWLTRCVSGYRREPIPFAIVLLARRPCNVIGSESPIELCPYALDICFPNLFSQGNATPVRPAAHRHTISRTLLAQMAGSAATPERPRWTLIGAGSLGSKLALHLARAGNGPEVVIDKSSMAPHNAARHALIPASGDMQVLWMDAKARLLCDALKGFHQEAASLVANVANVLSSKEHARQAWSKRSWAVVNAAASLVVREALASSELLPSRVIETSLFGNGTVGIITTEGPGRNPNTGDLIAEIYALLHEDRAIASTVFGDNAAMSRQALGQGCGSMTMAMSDGRLSLFAAGMSEYLLRKQRAGLPEYGGEVLIGRLSDDGFGIVWHVHSVPPVAAIRTTNEESWRVHVHPRAMAKIQEETARWPTVETGGVLLGRVSEASHTFHVVDVLDAPEDSQRSPRGFVLGTKGLRQKMTSYSEGVGWSLYCLGTWHSHLSASGPSPTDRATATAVSIARLMPAALLIHTPAGFHALLADAAGVSKGGA
jgi:hypothetical protein